MKRLKIEISLQSALIILGAFVAIYIAYLIRGILLLLFFAFILNSGLRPLVDKLHRRKVPRALSVLIIYIVILAVVGLILTLIVTQIINQTADLLDSLPNFVEETLNRIKEDVPGAREYLDNNDINSIVSDVQEALTGSKDISTIDTNSVFSMAMDLLGVLRKEGISIVESVTGGFFSVFIVIITSVYMLTSKDDIYEGLVKLLPVRQGKDVTRILKKVEVGLGEWLIGLLSVMFIIGFLSYTIVLIPGLFLNQSEYELVRFALVIGLTSGIMEIIPQLGAVIAFVFAVLMAIITGASLPIVIYIVVMFLALQQLEGLLISPIVMKSVVNIDPVISIFSALAGFQLGGPLLAVLAIPLVVAVQITIEDLSGNWASDKSKMKVIEQLKEHKNSPDSELGVVADLKERWHRMFASK